MSALIEGIAEAGWVLDRRGVAFLNLGDRHHSRKGEITRTYGLREFVRDQPCHTDDCVFMLYR
ncbi:MAG: hypothetical protein OXH99_18645 [Bryobacterales bacterium]|nr:hypothetical protein [Bryobacterales bacterium]